MTGLTLATMHLPREDMRATARRCLLGGMALLVAAGLVFQWSARWDVVGALAGGLGFGVFEFRREVRARLPEGELPPAPAQARWNLRERWFGVLIGLLAYTAAIGVLVWILGQEESALMGALVIGRFAGVVIAHLVGARHVARWEQSHGLLVAFSGEDDDERRFAVHPVRLLGRP